jgi:hypothetical protein
MYVGPGFKLGQSFAQAVEGFGDALAHHVPLRQFGGVSLLLPLVHRLELLGLVPERRNDAGDGPYDKLKKALRAEIDEAEWAKLYRATSQPFDPTKSGKIAIKVINHFGDGVLKVYPVVGKKK